LLRKQRYGEYNKNKNKKTKQKGTYDGNAVRIHLK
jgi:hypothetical protein